MKTIDPPELEALLESSQPVEILDIRPHDQFDKAHIDGAHRLPATVISSGDASFLAAIVADRTIISRIRKRCARAIGHV